MKTVDQARTDYLNEVFALVNSNKISVDDADKIIRSVQQYMESFTNNLIDGI